MTVTRIDILCCSLTETDDTLLARYENLLPEEELKRLRCFHSPASAKEFLVSRTLLRLALATRLQCEPSALQFTKNIDGKPVLSHPHSQWQFNLTHSHGWVALALCEGSAVGIDIESYSRRNNLRAIAQRFFSEEENNRLAECTEDEWIDYFLAIWTLKEAHAKALGCGLSKILSCSSIMVDLRARTIDLKLTDAASTTEKISSWLCRLDENFVLALVAHGIAFSGPQIFRCVPLRSMEILTLDISARGI